MTQSHPPTLLTIASRAFGAGRGGSGELGVARGDRILVAVSGGPDSMALLHVLARLKKKVGVDVVAHGVDHGLRAAASEELDLAESFARALAVPFARTRVDVAAGSNLQSRARAARYAALEAAAEHAGAKFIATAHHMEDRAETLLLRLLRGSGPAGLAVLPPRAGARIRPILRASREAIDAHVARHAIPFAVDPSNLDPRFTRARVRSELLPLLRTLSPGIVQNLCALADQLSELRAGTRLETAESAAFPLAQSRGSREAIKVLLRARSTKARIPLPGGLEASYDRVQAGVVVHAASPPNRAGKRA